MKYLIRAGIVVGICVGVLLVAAYVHLGGLGTAIAVEIGQNLPDFTLKDLDGKEHTLSQYRGNIVVIEFCSYQCPWSRGADPKLIELWNKYKDKGVVFLGIDSNTPNAVEDIKKYAATLKKDYPILKDVDNVYADKLGASRTPEIFIVDKDGKLVYHGAFDNRTNPDGTPTKHYVADAIESLLNGKTPDPNSTSAWGCTIKRK
jgi:peroxiredoxin